MKRLAEIELQGLEDGLEDGGRAGRQGGEEPKRVPGAPSHLASYYRSRPLRSWHLPSREESGAATGAGSREQIWLVSELIVTLGKGAIRVAFGLAAN